MAPTEHRAAAAAGPATATVGTAIAAETATSATSATSARRDVPGGRSVEFGVFPTPEAGRLAEVLATAQLADRLGLDLVAVQDHPYHRDHVDTMALLAGLATTTERVRLVPDVANLPLRGAAVLAKQAATVDLLSGGRFELGIGAGAFWDAIAGMGGPRRSPGEAVAAVAEAIAVIRALWTGDRGIRAGGEHYRLDGADGGPRPAHDIGIWVGADGPRMLRLVGRLADGWLPSLAYLPVDRLADASARIDDAAVAAGRDPGAIRRVYNVHGSITDGRRGDGLLDGPVDLWVDTLARLSADRGMDGFVLWSDLGDERTLRRFAEEVAPGVREALGAARA